MVSGNCISFDHLGGQHRTLCFLEDLHHLLEDGDWGIDDVIRQQNSKWLVADQLAGSEHCVAKAQSFFLAHVSNVDHVGNLADDPEQIGFPFLLKHLLQLIADVEVIFDRLLAPAGDDDDLIAASRQRLFDAVLNDGLVHQRQHLFGLCFGGGKEASA